MDIMQLKHFISISETLHFGKSSRQCNLSPSAFTRSIKRLETDLGYDLLERSNRSVTLTPAGAMFRDYAVAILDKLKEFQHNAVINEKNLKGVISIFCTVTACYSILPPIIKDFRALYPDIHIKLQTGDAGSTMQKAVDNEVDVTITMMGDKLPDNVVFIPLTVTPLVFVAPAFETLFLKKETRNFDPSNSPFILPEKGVARKRTDRWFSEKGIKPDIYAQVSGNEAILAMVSLGCGIGVVPELVIDRSPLRESMRILDAKPPLEPYQVGICFNTKKQNNPFVKAFSDLVRKKREDGEF